MKTNASTGTPSVLLCITRWRSKVVISIVAIILLAVHFDVFDNAVPETSDVPLAVPETSDVPLAVHFDAFDNAVPKTSDVPLVTWDKNEEQAPLTIDADAYSVFFGNATAYNTDRDSPSNSRLVNAADFHAAWYADVLHHNLKEAFHFHRKQWEFIVIYRAITTLVDFKAGPTGFGFGVGIEPLPSMLVAAGAKKLVASDMPMSDTGASNWEAGNQYAAELSATWNSKTVDKATYFAAASFRSINMKALPDDLLRGGFDFTWSCSALEHQGTVNDAIAYMVNTARMLKPGGVAVHTTELIVSSLFLLVQMPNAFTMLRMQDIERLAIEVEKYDAKLTRRDYFAGLHKYDVRCDVQPYHSEEHLKLYRKDLLPSCHTSVLLVIQKNKKAPSEQE